MQSDLFVHYGLHEPEADDEWKALVPRGGIIYLGKTQRPFTISMFHQLRCLDIIRVSLKAENSRDSQLIQHCFNYLRQTALCHSGTRMDPLTDKTGTRLSHKPVACNNWEVIYKRTKENQEVYHRAVVGTSVFRTLYSNADVPYWIGVKISAPAVNQQDRVH